MEYGLRSTVQFDKWFSGLKDAAVKIKILARLDRLENGNFGDCKPIGQGLFELRLFFGPGWRIYYTVKGNQVVILLVGGNKSTQAGDIEKAARILKTLEE
jgi:putative addiction module killer protein